MTVTGREQDVVASFIAFADRLVDDFDILDLTIELTEDCARLLDIAAAGLLLADPVGVLHLLAATSEQARSLELFQLQRDEGPCLDCFHSGQPISVADLRLESARWPRFAHAAADQGFVSVQAVPVRLRDQMIGALGLFGTTADLLPQADVDLARAFAHVAALALAQHDAGPEASLLLPTLQSTVASRGLLEMAKGVLAEADDVSMDVAASRLRRYAKSHRQRLTEVAQAVVTINAPGHRQLMSGLREEAVGAPTTPG